MFCPVQYVLHFIIFIYGFFLLFSLYILMHHCLVFLSYPNWLMYLFPPSFQLIFQFCCNVVLNAFGFCVLFILSREIFSPLSGYFCFPLCFVKFPHDFFLAINPLFNFFYSAPVNAFQLLFSFHLFRKNIIFQVAFSLILYYCLCFVL